MASVELLSFNMYFSLPTFKKMEFFVYGVHLLSHTIRTKSGSEVHILESVLVFSLFEFYFKARGENEWSWSEIYI